MVSQYETRMLAEALDQPPILHSVTLVHPVTEDERRISVWTKTDSFSDVQLAVSRKRSELKLNGYQIFDYARVDDDVAALVDRVGLGTLLIQLYQEAAKHFEAQKTPGLRKVDDPDWMEVIRGLEVMIPSAQVIDGLYVGAEELSEAA